MTKLEGRPFEFVSDYIGVAEHILNNFNRSITKSKMGYDTLDIIDDIQDIIESSSDYPKVMKKVYDYLLRLDVKDVIRHPNTTIGFIYKTPEDFAEKYAPYFTSEKQSGKDGEPGIKLNELNLPIGYYRMPLSDYELQLKEERRINNDI